MSDSPSALRKSLFQVCFGACWTLPATLFHDRSYSQGQWNTEQIKWMTPHLNTPPQTCRTSRQRLLIIFFKDYSEPWYLLLNSIVFCVRASIWKTYFLTLSMLNTYFNTLVPNFSKCQELSLRIKMLQTDAKVEYCLWYPKFDFGVAST